MELSSNTIKQGVSEVGNFRMDYTVTYNGENKVSKIEAQVKRLPGEGRPEVHSGYASFVLDTTRYSFQLTNTVSNGERRTLIDNFENEIAELIK